MKVQSVVVTFNRKDLLKRNLSCLRAQETSDNIDFSIIVVDNGCTDGTSEWLDLQTDILVIHQNNVGGSGGFHTGIKQAYDLGAEWIWCMDDDVFPRPECLINLLHHSDYPNVGILAPRRILDGKIFTNDFIGYNLTNPFASLYTDKLKRKAISGPTEIAGTAFEGLCVRRNVVEAIGLPNKDLFIFCDDTDFCLRTYLAGFKQLYVPEALMDKHLFFSDDKWSERNKKKKWKRYYQIRNSTYLNHHYGKNWAVRYMRGLWGVTGYILIATVTSPFSDGYKISDIKTFWKAFNDGIKERLGKI